MRYYRVDILLVSGNVFQPYSGNRVDSEMAHALARHLKRNKTGYRILEDGVVIEEYRP